MAGETKHLAMRLPDGTIYQLRNLPWPMVAAIEADYRTSWILVVDMPHANGAVLADVARAVATVNELDPPKIDTVADLAEIVSTLVVVDDAGNLLDLELGELPDIAWAPAPT